MMTTELKKFVLYFLIAAVGLWLWQDWQKAHPARMHAPQNEIQAASLPNGAATTAAEKTLTPTTTPIHVKTDLLDVTINPLGGNIVYAGLTHYPLTIDAPNAPYPLLHETTNQTYIAESGVSGVNQDHPIAYQVEKTDYQMGPNDETLRVHLTWVRDAHITLHKTFTFNRGSYLVNVTNHIENNGDTPVHLQWYNQLTRTPPEKETGFLHTMTTFTGGAYSSEEKPYNKASFKELGQERVAQTVKGGWVAMEQQYFLSAWIPNPNTTNHFYSFEQNDKDRYTIGMLSDKQTIEPGTKSDINYQLYIGPEIVEQLEKAAPHLKLTIDYGWFWFFSIAILWLMKHIYQVVGNWGWSIILVTVLIKAAFYHLSASSYRSMARMRQLQPKLQALKERCGQDKQKFSQETMALYKTEKVNPFGGCLPILVQIPVFIALYWVLLESVELRQSPFILWIHDLAAPDPYFILPIVMGATMLIQQKLSPAPPDPMQAKMMLLLPIVFTVLFLNFPAGLVLYWTVNNTLSILQQWFVMRRVEKTPAKKKK